MGDRAVASPLASGLGLNISPRISVRRAADDALPWEPTTPAAAPAPLPTGVEVTLTRMLLCRFSNAVCMAVAMPGVHAPPTSPDPTTPSIRVANDRRRALPVLPLPLPVLHGGPRLRLPARPDPSTTDVTRLGVPNSAVEDRDGVAFSFSPRPDSPARLRCDAVFGVVALGEDVFGPPADVCGDGSGGGSGFDGDDGMRDTTFS